MKGTKLTVLASLAVLLAVMPMFSVAQEKTATVAAPTYNPPMRGAPGGRVGGGTRGTGQELFVLSVLAPDHSGLTVSEQPSLYWFISRATSLPVEVTVMDPRATVPVLEVRLSGAVDAGVRGIRLADHGIRLEQGVPYRWYVSVVPDPNRRSRDILAGGVIERVDRPAGLAAKLAQAHQEEVPFLYAEAGLWYDALAAISELIARAPRDESLWKQRASLLAQVGLRGVGEEEGGGPR